MSTRLPECACLNCGRVLDAATPTKGDDDEPEEGSFTICLYCGHLMVFAADKTFRQPTDAEMIDIAGNPPLLIAQKIRKAYERRH